jgi:hypothetical protein
VIDARNGVAGAGIYDEGSTGFGGWTRSGGSISFELSFSAQRLDDNDVAE